MSLKNNDDMIDFMAKVLVEEARKNKNNQPDFEADEDFGLVPNKPVYTLFKKLIDGEEEYLDSLYTLDGHKLSWERTGSTSFENMGGSVDCYDTFLPSGDFYKTIYINMYGSRESSKTPKGFKRIVDNNSSRQAPEIAMSNSHPKACGKCGRTNPADSEFCQYCGSKIENKFFKIIPEGNPQKAKILESDKTTNILENAVIIACIVVSIALCFCLLTMKSQKEEITTLNSTVSQYESKYEKAKQESNDNYQKYHSIINFLRSPDAGYASSNYYASDSIVVLNKNGFAKDVYITCKYYNTSIYFNNADTSVVLPTWSNSWNGNTISISFSPVLTGTSIVKFTNDYNNESFRVMVIVV